MVLVCEACMHDVSISGLVSVCLQAWATLLALRGTSPAPLPAPQQGQCAV